YPYHYAMLAVGLLLENALPGRAVGVGGIDLPQAERVGAGGEDVLHQRLELPIVTDAPRLWQRLGGTYPHQLVHAVRRFLALYADSRHAAWPALMRLQGGPDQEALRGIFAAHLDSFPNLQTLGARELLVALCEADGNIARTLDWVCGPGP